MNKKTLGIKTKKNVPHEQQRKKIKKVVFLFKSQIQFLKFQFF